MNIVVCVKQVIDAEAVIELNEEGSVITEGQTLVIDPYSEFAVEKAIQLKESCGGEVHIVSVGDQGCAPALRHALAMGADSALLIEDDSWRTTGAALRVAQLAEVIGEINPDLVMGGWKSGDMARAQVMVRLGARLGLPCVSMAVGLEATEGGIQVTREVEEGLVVADLALPAVVTAQQGLAEPRYPSVRDIMQARKKGIESRPAADLAASSPDEAPLEVRVVSRTLKPARVGGRIVEGPLNEVVPEVVRLLHDEANVI